MGLFKRNRKERRSNSTYSNTVMMNDHNLSVAMFVAAQPDAWVDPDEQQREADEAYDREHPVDEIEDAR